VNENFKKFVTTNLVEINHRLSILRITWYNKVHNSVINPAKQNTILYLRAAKHFNKGRYSRNRQLYRTGVYWCIWLNVVIVYGLHFYFYRVVFSFGYLWLPLAAMTLVMFSSRLYKYRFYSVDQLIQEFKEFNNFLFSIFFKIKTLLTLQGNAVKQVVSTFIKNMIFLITEYVSIKLSKIIGFCKVLFL
jgi:hypothetical protein